MEGVGVVARAAGDKQEVTVTGGSSSRACAVSDGAVLEREVLRERWADLR